MASQRQRNAFFRFLLHGITDTNVEIGRGSYAVVEEVIFHGLSCVGKSIHRELYDNSPPRAQAQMLERFAGECELLSQIRHPHIVQFLGVYFKEAAEGQMGAPLPVIVMERLHCTLTSTIDRHGQLPEEISHPILREVATGLAYLHARPVVHRDLSTNNVLLATNMSAKISDLGVAKILDLSPARMVQMTTCPGTPSYMPPEALTSGRAVYTTKIDIFSYGNLMTHVLSGEWPIPTQAFRFDPDNPNADPIPITEAERREEYLHAIGNHALMGLIRQCLSNNPAARPEASDILTHLEERAPQHPLFFTDRVEALQRISERVAENDEQIRLHRQEVEQLQREVDEVRAQGDEQVQDIEQQLENRQQQMDQLVVSHRLEVEGVRARVIQLSRECERLSREGEELRMSLRAKEEEVEAAEALARAREVEASEKEEQHQREVESVRAQGEEQVQEKVQEIEQKQQRINQLILSYTVEMEGEQARVCELSGECEALKASMRANEEQLKAADAMIKAREKEAAAKEEELLAVRQELAVRDEMLEAKEGELSLKNRQLSLKEGEVASKEEEVALKVREVEAIRNEIAALRVERDAQKEAIAARDSQLRAKQLEISSKESVLATKESTIVQLRSQATMVRLLNPQSKLRWKTCADMPGAMGAPEVVRINNDLYVGGGDGDAHEYTIFRYSPAGDTWSVLPECPICCFGLTELNGRLLLVGGRKGKNATSDVYTLEESGEWEMSLPPLSTARSAPKVFRYKSILIACGGDTNPLYENSAPTTQAVEVLDSKVPQWYNADPLPLALVDMSCAIIDDTCYLFGGDTNYVICASLSSLIQAAITRTDPHSPTDPQSSASPPSAIWKELPGCPCEASAAVGLGGCLLAIGGFLPDTTISASVHVYSHSSNSWVRVPNTDTPQPRYSACATQLASGDLILIGGRGVANGDDASADSASEDSVDDDALCSSVFVAFFEL